jgi:hypothetical protein
VPRRPASRGSRVRRRFCRPARRTVGPVRTRTVAGTLPRRAHRARGDRILGSPVRRRPDVRAANLQRRTATRRHRTPYHVDPLCDGRPARSTFGIRALRAQFAHRNEYRSDARDRRLTGPRPARRPAALRAGRVVCERPSKPCRRVSAAPLYRSPDSSGAIDCGLAVRERWRRDHGVHRRRGRNRQDPHGRRVPRTRRGPQRAHHSRNHGRSRGAPVRGPFGRL